jgi:hypothetical protein
MLTVGFAWLALSLELAGRRKRGVTILTDLFNIGQYRS